MLSLLKKPALSIALGGQELVRIEEGELPIEKTFSAEIPSGSPVLSFTDSRGAIRNFDLSSAIKDGEPWIHLCVRVSPYYVCQVDCILSRDSKAPLPDEATSGIRFQPFFLAEFENPPEFAGHGLLGRGLHYPGHVSPGWVTVMVNCDACAKSFRMKSIHTGFSNTDYAYCSQSFHTLLIPANSAANLPACKTCEGTFARENSLRCPHCLAEFTRFAPGFADRKDEYYGACLYGIEPQLVGASE